MEYINKYDVLVEDIQQKMLECIAKQQKIRKVLVPSRYSKYLFANYFVDHNFKLFGVDIIFGNFDNVQVLTEDEPDIVISTTEHYGRMDYQKKYEEQYRISRFIEEIKVTAVSIQNKVVRDRLLNVVENFERGWPIRHDLMRRRDI